MSSKVIPEESKPDSQSSNKGSKILSRQGGATVEIADEQYVLKYGTRVKPNEADAMKLVADHTNVPVPQVLQYEQIGNMGFIVMSRILGEPLSSTWANMPAQDRNAILTQLKGYVAEWRQIPQPAECNGAYVCGVMGGAVSRVAPIPGPKFTGPFPDDPTFREAIGKAYYMTAGRRRTPEEVTESIPTASFSVLTHCDLAPRNVMVDGTKITGIIDWECAGWYPEFWEYTSLRLGHEEWDYMVSEFLEPHPEAFDAVKFVRHVLF